MTPNQRWIPVLSLIDVFRVSERRACVVVSQRHCAIRGDAEMRLRDCIRVLAAKHSCYGYWRVRVILIRNGFQLNHRLVQRLRRFEGLHGQRPERCNPKAARVLIVTRGQYPNRVQAIDSQSDETADSRPVKILNAADGLTLLRNGGNSTTHLGIIHYGD